MGKLATRASRGILAGAMVAALAGCATTVTGVAVKAPTAPDETGATVALMDTGPYATAAGRPFASVGDKPDSQSLMESHRLGEYTIGPWEIDAEVRVYPGMLATAQIGVQPTNVLEPNGILSEPMIAAVRKHGYVTGFSSLRTTPESDEQKRTLFNYVMEFPNAAAAVAAADELAAINPPPFGALDPAGRPADLIGNPEARAKFFDLPDGVTRVESYTPHGAFVFYQTAQTSKLFLGGSAENMVGRLIDRQKSRIDEFTPTPPDKMPDLPLDPTGNLLAKTLWSPDDKAPSNMGAWTPRAWLHFEGDPVSAASMFNDTGVSAVSQRLTTIYEAKNPDAAKTIAESANGPLNDDPEFRAIDGVPGLPAATCFERVGGAQLPATAPMSYRRIVWTVRCFAWADRYAYTAFSDTADDARQQMAAQYRILAGE